MKKALLFVLLLILAGSLRAQTPFNFGANVGYNAPAGKFSDVYKGGVLGEAYLLYSSGFPGLDFSLTVGYSQYKYKNDFFKGQVIENFPGNTSDFNPDWKLTDVPIMVGGRMGFPVPGINPYITGEIGVHMLKYDSRFKEGNISASSSGVLHIELNNSIESVSETAFGFAVGGGMEFPLVPRVGFDLGVKLNYMSATFSKKYTVVRNSNSSFTSDELKNPMYLTAKMGLTIHL
ncbi:MAG: outer membrane beta-barrel protein [Bacteroidetes bacterium]|nr:outer membrane beta-barrel protein [Bacteroidota bacterium]